MSSSVAGRPVALPAAAALSAVGPAPAAAPTGNLAAPVAACAEGTFVAYEANGVALCVHGDAAAAGSAALALPAQLPGIPCYGGTGPRVHVYYAYKAAQPSRLVAERAQLRDLVAQVDALFNQSAQQSGGSRHVRWVTTATCALVVTPLKIPTSSDIFQVNDAFTQALASHTLAREDHALVFLDYGFGGFLCGFGSIRSDSRASSANASNHYQGTAEVANGNCRTARSAAHELAHTLGAVQQDAPHHSYSGHCYDGTQDVMCYDDGAIPSPVVAGACPAGPSFTLDCGHDDYFSARPAAGSFLATHWNVASSTLLSAAAPPRWDRVPNPTVTVTGVAGATTVVGFGKSDDPPLTASVNAAGGAVKDVRYFLDDASYNQPATTAPWTGPSLPSMMDLPGWHNLYAVLRMTDGRERLSPVVRVHFVDPLLSPDGGASVSGVVPLSVSIPADLAGVSRVDFTVDGAVVASASGPFAASYDSSGLPDGAHEFGATLFGATGSRLGSVVSTVLVSAAGGSFVLIATPAGSRVAGTVPIAVSAMLPAGSTITSVTLLEATRYGETSADVTETGPASFQWHVCGSCDPGSQVTLTAEVHVDNAAGGGTVRLQRSYRVAAAPAPTATLRLAAGARLRSGTVVTLPFSVAHLGASADYVQVFSRLHGYLGDIPTAAPHTSVRVRIPAGWVGTDALWLRVRHYEQDMTNAFSAHVPIVWTR